MGAPRCSVAGRLNPAGRRLGFPTGWPLAVLEARQSGCALECVEGDALMCCVRGDMVRWSYCPITPVLGFEFVVFVFVFVCVLFRLYATVHEVPGLYQLSPPLSLL